MAVALLVTAVSALLLIAVAAGLRWQAARNVLDDLDEVLPPLPEGHRPPPGLGPISPSPRTLAAEAERGLRDLQLFLLDAA